MTDATANNLTREKLQQLLGSIGSQKTNDSEQPEAAEYNWNLPHYFNNTQLAKLEDFTERTELAIANQFSTLCHTNFEVKIKPTTQLFAKDFFHQVSAAEQKDYYLIFSIDRNPPCGLLGFSSKTAIAWAMQLLGDIESKTEEEDRELSQLENSLLTDITLAVIKAFSESHGTYNFQPAQTFAKELSSFEPQGTDPLCRIDFTVTRAGSENSSDAYFLILCDKLEPVTGKALLAKDNFSTEQIAKAIEERLHETEVYVTAQLGSSLLTFEQIMTLEPGDVVLLNKKIDDPVDLIVEGQMFLRGRAAKASGKYAVLITEVLASEQ